MKTPALRKVGFLGAGNMATALIRGLLSAGRYCPKELWASDVDRRKCRRIAQRYGIGWTADNCRLVRGSEIVVLAVKPQHLPAVLDEIAPVVQRHHLVISIAAGFPLRRLRDRLGDRVRLVRAMPNTPALVGRGMSVLVRGGRATQADERRALEVFRAVGEALAVRDESLLDPVTGLSGSGPAYVYRFAEALIAGGVRAGLPENLARQLTLRTLEGACAMLLQSGQRPEELRAMVSSPGGTTLAGLARLEEGGFFDLVAEAVGRATERARELAASS
jgi:pyrroline-5-carboxylate reductase